MPVVAGAFLFTMAPLALTGGYDTIYASNLAEAHTYRSKQARPKEEQAWRQPEITPVNIDEGVGRRRVAP